MVFTMENAGQEKDDSVTLLATPCESPDLKVKVTSKREHSNSGGVFEIPVCLDDDKRTRPQQKRPRVYPGFQNSAGSSYQWSVRGPSVAQFVQGKRIVYPPLLQPFKSSTTQSKFKAMDYAPSPESLYAPDSGKSTFAASPNSLYMYDQERHDMQNTLSSGMFGLSCRTAEMISGNIEPEFDLNPQYENSDSLEGFILSNNLLASACDSSISSSCTGRSEKQSCNDMISYMQVNQQELKLGGPTLAELNMDPFLMEDIDTIISNDEGEQKPQLRVPVTHMVSESAKPAPAALTNTATCFPPSQTSPGNLQPAACLQSNLFTNRTSNVAVVPPISVPRIKCEPEDTLDYSSCKTHLQKVLSSTQPMEYAESKPNLHKMQPSSEPQKPAVSSLSTTSTTISPCSRQVMPVVGQSRALPLGQQVKSESVEEKWKEIEKFIHDKETTCSRKRKRHASGGSAIISDEEDFRPSQLRSYSDEDSDSDADSDFSDTPLEESLTELARKSKQYFWQYNVQAKGPKGTRLKLNVHDNDPHHPSNFKDPVFDATSTSLVGIRHGGKARKGDGNEVTPNPKKLFQIGQQLYKLNRQINGFQLTSDQPASVRNKSRKEKNKLASRACRLKKKAQHEANKVKLTGLDIEQGELLDVIHLIWPQLKKRAQQLMNGVMLSPGSSPVLTDQLNALITSLYKTVIAGNTTDYVNEVIAKVEDGDLTGGLVLKPKAEKRTCD